jgi:hypothetical protein
MYTVYEVFKSDGKRYPLYTNNDCFECEVWMKNHAECTNALRIGRSYLIIE